MNIKKLNQNDIQNIIELYKNGMSKNQIAKIYNVSFTTIYRKLIENNITNDIRHFSEKMQKDICNRYLERKSIASVAEEYNIEPCYVISILNANRQRILSNDESHRFYSLNEDYFETIDTPNKAYILGLIYADGCIHEKNRAIYLGLQEQDKSLLEKINIELNNSKPLEFIDLSGKNHKNMYRIVLYSEKMQKDLINAGVRYRKSWNLDFPYFLNPELYSHFCRGYFDGDGSVFQTKSQKYMRTGVDFVGTEQVCQGIQTILANNGIYSAMYDSVAHNGITRDLHIIRKDDVRKLFYWLYENKTLYMERKYNSYVSFLNINNSLLD